MFQLKFEYDSHKQKHKEIILTYNCLNQLLVDVIEYLKEVVFYQTNHQQEITVDGFYEKLTERVWVELEYWLDRFSVTTKKQYVGIKVLRFWNEEVVGKFDGVLPVVIVDQV